MFVFMNSETPLYIYIYPICIFVCVNKCNSEDIIIQNTGMEEKKCGSHGYYALFKKWKF